MRFLMIFLSIIASKNFISANESITFHSQAKQDEFAYTILYNLLNKQDAGYYLEIGAGEPIHINNTYVFEKDCAWQGISIDISENLIPEWQMARKNPLLLTDATQLNYSWLLEEFPYAIDYLSLDIDGLYDTALIKVINANHIFKIITIEHDAYRYGDIYRNREREILTERGYYLLCADVSHDGCAFEDWWIYPDFFPSDLLQQLQSLHLQGKSGTEIVQLLRESLNLLRN